MKKFALILALITLLAGCAKFSGTDYSAYKGMSAKQIFDSGEKNMAKGNFDKSTKDFEALDAIYPFGKYSQQGQLDIIYTYYKSGDNASSLVAADRYIRLYPRGRDVDYAYYMKGLVYYEEGFTWLQRLAGSDPSERDMSDKKHAYMAFAELVHAFPRSPYAYDAAQHMTYIRDLMARHELHIARFYYKRKAYVAAANRAASVVQHYNGTPEVPNALAMMVKSYRQLGLSALANNSYAILQASYPDSKAYRSVS